LFILFPSFLIPEYFIQPIKFAWDFALIGLLGGALGGMVELVNYSVWLRSEPDEKALRRVARLLYLTPFSAWMMAFFIGTVIHFLTGYEASKAMKGIENFASLLIGFVQFRILRRVHFGAKSM
jgi:hypothetical protein